MFFTKLPVGALKTSEAANLVFQWILILNSVKHKFFRVSITKQDWAFWDNSGYFWKKLQLDVLLGSACAIELCTHTQFETINWLLYHTTFTAWKMSKYGVISGPYFPLFGLNTRFMFVNLRIQSLYRKTRARNNSVFGHFSRSDCYHIQWVAIVNKV